MLSAKSGSAIVLLYGKRSLWTSLATCCQTRNLLKLCLPDRAWWSFVGLCQRTQRESLEIRSSAGQEPWKRKEMMNKTIIRKNEQWKGERKNKYRKIEPEVVKRRMELVKGEGNHSQRRRKTLLKLTRRPCIMHPIASTFASCSSSCRLQCSDLMNINVYCSPHPFTPPFPCGPPSSPPSSPPPLLSLLELPRPFPS